jgi:hypothetical protein
MTDYQPNEYDWLVELDGVVWRIDISCQEVCPCQHNNSLNKGAYEIRRLIRAHPMWKQTNLGFWNHFGGGVDQGPEEPDEP